MSVSNTFGGLIQVYSECFGSDLKQAPRLAQLYQTIVEKQIPNDLLIHYAASSQLWPGMKFDIATVGYAFVHQKFGFLDWYFEQVKPIILAHFDILLGIVCRAGSAEGLDWLEQHIGLTPNSEMYQQACLHGNLSTIEWLHSHKEWRPATGHYELLKQVMIADQTAMVKWLDDKWRFNYNYIFYEDILEIISAGSLGSIKFLRTKLMIPSMNLNRDLAFRTACMFGHLELAQYIEEIWYVQINDCMNDAFTNACQGGHLEVAKWLISYYGTTHLSPNVIQVAFQVSCSQGYLEMGQWLRETFPHIDPSYRNFECYQVTKLNGHQHVLDWLEQDPQVQEYLQQ